MGREYVVSRIAPCRTVAGCAILSLEHEAAACMIRVPASQVAALSEGDTLVFIPADETTETPAHLRRGGAPFLMAWVALGPSILV